MKIVHVYCTHVLIKHHIVDGQGFLQQSFAPNCKKTFLYGACIVQIDLNKTSACCVKINSQMSFESNVFKNCLKVNVSKYQTFSSFWTKFMWSVLSSRFNNQSYSFTVSFTSQQLKCWRRITTGCRTAWARENMPLKR